MTKKGLLVLALMLILIGIGLLLGVSFQGKDKVEGVLALIAGILFLLDKPWA